jgi:hypothetical protein
MDLPNSEWFNPNGIDYRSIMTPAQWAEALDRFTVGDVPPHLKSSNALKQATEIALTLRLGDEDDEILDIEAMLGVAWYVAKAFNAGRPVNSLGFVAVRLANCARDEDWSWARDFPLNLSDREAKTAWDWVEFGLREFERLETEHCPDRLRASRRVDDIIYLVKKYGRDAVKKAISTPLYEGRWYTSWSQLERVIKA